MPCNIFFIPVHAFMVRWQRHLFYIHEFRPMKILSALDLFHDLPDAAALSTVQNDVLRHSVDKRLTNAHARWDHPCLSCLPYRILYSLSSITTCCMTLAQHDFFEFGIQRYVTYLYAAHTRYASATVVAMITLICTRARNGVSCWFPKEQRKEA